VVRRWAPANLVAVPEAHAYDLLLFGQRNPKPCPVLDSPTSASGVPFAIGHAPGHMAIPGLRDETLISP
jgi:uncharacterized protein YcsI (UPF0317 family)